MCGVVITTCNSFKLVKRFAHAGRHLSCSCPLRAFLTLENQDFCVSLLEAWTPVNCQRENCPNGGNVKAVKVSTCTMFGSVQRCASFSRSVCFPGATLGHDGLRLRQVVL